MTEQRTKAAAEPPLDCRVRLDQEAFEKLADALAPLMREPESPPTFRAGYIAALTDERVRQIVQEELSRLCWPGAPDQPGRTG